MKKHRVYFGSGSKYIVVHKECLPTISEDKRLELKCWLEEHAKPTPTGYGSTRLLDMDFNVQELIKTIPCFICREL